MTADREFLDRLDLSMGQIQANEFVHNGGWYDGTGHKIGWGDLSCNDIRTICERLQDNEVFFVLGEHDSYWNFFPTSRHKMAGKDVNNPGIDYVFENCRFVIVHGTIFVPTDRQDKESIEFYARNLGPQAQLIKRDDIIGYLDGKI